MTAIGRALVVEDDPVIAGSLAKTLVRHFADVVVEQAGSVAEVATALARGRPHLVLLDLGLPDGTGFDVIDQLDRLRARPIIVVVTVFDDDEHLFAALQRGIDGYVLKEDSGADFARILGEILDGRPPLSPSVARRILDQFRRPEPDGDKLTARERDVAELIASGNTVAAAAEILQISANTVQHHVKHLYHKLGVNSRSQLTRRAIELGLISTSGSPEQGTRRPSPATYAGDDDDIQ
jgi:DNA-binding NarL/FixJ family response regulator